jgi:hypothetical protein
MMAPRNTIMTSPTTTVVPPWIMLSHISPTMTISVIHEVRYNAYHDGARKYHHAAASESGYHHEPMNKMIKKTSGTLSNRL